MSRKRSIRGNSNHGSTLRPCRYCLRGTCTRTSCEYWHPPECHNFYKTETGWKSWDKCMFSRIIRLMNNQTTSPKRLLFPKRRESDDRNAVALVKNCTTIGLCLARLGVVLKEANSPRETRCQKSWDQLCF